MNSDPREFAEDHIKIIEYFPNDKEKAKNSIAILVANCILSLDMSTLDMFKRIEEYIEYYKTGK